MDISKLEVMNLADCPEHFDTVCGWLWEQWGKNDGKSLTDIVYRTKHCLGKDKVPMTFVALMNGEAVGTFSLWTNDLKSRQDLTPWFAVLFVRADMRRQGIGAKIQDFAITKIKELGYAEFYLITDLENHYEKTGWKFMDLAPLQDGCKTRLYKYSIK